MRHALITVVALSLLHGCYIDENPPGPSGPSQEADYFLDDVEVEFGRRGPGKADLESTGHGDPCQGTGDALDDLVFGSDSFQAVEAVEERVTIVSLGFGCTEGRDQSTGGETDESP